MYRIAKIVAEVRVVAAYTCRHCGFVDLGETHRERLDADSAQGLGAAAERMDLGRQFPTGWANFSDGLKCVKCLNKEKQNAV